VGIGSFSLSPLAVAAADSNMRLLRGRGGYVVGSGDGSDRLGCNGWHLVLGGRLIREGRQGCRRFCTEGAARGAFRSWAGRENRLTILNLEVGYLLFDLRFKFVRRTAEFVEHLADLARDLGQLLGPKDNQGQKEEEDRLRKAHAVHHTAGAGKAAMTAHRYGDKVSGGGG
jgi:hypothetical protein